MMRRVVLGGSQRATALTTPRCSLSFKPRLRELQFLFNNVFDMHAHYQRIGYADAADPQTTTALFEECGKLSANVLFPLYTSGDTEGCSRRDDGVVQTPSGYKEAYAAVVDGGWAGICGPEAYGGQDMPPSIGVATREMMGTANWAFLGYPGLTAGAVSTLNTWGSDALKAAFLPHLTTGKWSGTMCLTEPHCGTDLGQVKTKAERMEGEEGGLERYRINGTKIFITGGDQDLTENIVHIVLARIPGAPSGTKGLSLFLVPKYLEPSNSAAAQSAPTTDTTTEAAKRRRNVTCVAVESKMGIKASATCQLAFENSEGYLIGKEHEGMREMFTFMNEARIGAAIQGVCHAELSLQNALAYARERRSMRSLSGTKDDTAVADRIVHHPNVRSNILFCKAVSEAGRAMCLDLGRMVDLIHTAPNDTARREQEEELGFYTPIAKALLTELGLEAASAGMQVFGGHGYIKGNGMEQILRDARIGTLYEGTTGVQGLDFIGRKVLKSKSRAPAKFAGKLGQLARQHMLRTDTLGTCARQLFALSLQWRFGVGVVALNAMGNNESVGAASQDLLLFAGYAVLGYYWLRMAAVAQREIDRGADVDGYYQAKVDTCRFYFLRVLPRTSNHFTVMMQNADPLIRTDQLKWDL